MKASAASEVARSRKERAALYLLAVAAAAAVCAVSWPGFMSFDSLYALRQAREGIVESAYPPIVSYVWWLAERVLPGQGGMFALQNLLVFLGVAKFGLAARAPAWLVAATLLLTALAPATLGPMLVVWKDVAFGGLLALGAGFIVEFRHSRHWSDAAIGLGLVALGSAYRLNGLPAALTLLILLAWPAAGSERSGWRWAATAAGTALSALAIVLLATALSTWRLPDFKRLSPISGHHGWTMVGDLVGISLCSGESFLPDAFYPQMPDLDLLRVVYHPEHIQRSFGPLHGAQRLQSRGFAAVPRLQQRWLEAVHARPGCFLRHRANVAVYLLGLNPGKVFYVTDPGVPANELGVSVEATALTNTGVRWVQTQADSAWARTWVFILVASAGLVHAWFRRWRPWLALVPYFSGLAYLGVGMLVLPAADLRYQFWVVLAMLLTVLAGFGSRVARFEP